MINKLFIINNYYSNNNNTTNTNNNNDNCYYHTCYHVVIIIIKSYYNYIFLIFNFIIPFLFEKCCAEAPKSNSENILEYKNANRRSSCLCVLPVEILFCLLGPLCEEKIYHALKGAMLALLLPF